MARNATTLKKGDNLNPRGRGFKALLFETIREESLLGLTSESTKEEAEKAFISHAAVRAFDSADQGSATLLKEFLSKSYPSLKSTLEKFVFAFPVDGTDLQKSSAILTAVSNGDIPPDVGQLIVSIVKDNSVIEANTDMKERIESIEKSLGIGNE